MIDYETYAKIHHLHIHERMTVAQLTRELSIDPRTITYWLGQPRFRPRQAAQRASKLDAYKPAIKRLLAQHPFSAVQILQRLREQGYDGGISILRSPNRFRLTFEINRYSVPAEYASQRLARFPVRETLYQLDWTWPKKIDRLRIQNLFHLKFIEERANVILVGGVGLAKTHPGCAACHESYSVLFASAIDTINTLTAAQAAGRLKADLGKLLRPTVLILDELGYLRIDKTGADLLFQIISQRYERGSTIITTNRVYKKWPEIFCTCPGERGRNYATAQVPL